MPGPLRLALLGQSAAYDGEAPVRCASKKAFALFAYLALERRSHSRRSLALLFWGSRDAEAARTSLRATLFRLPDPLARCVAIDRETLRITDSAALACDVEAFEALAQGSDLAGLEQAATLYKGHLLDDFDADATPEFDDWLDRERARLKQTAYALFDRLIVARLERATRAPASDARMAYDAVIAAAQHWLALDPAAEVAHRHLIRAYVDTGRRDAAQSQLDACRRALAVVEGRALAPETRALLAASSEAALTARGATADRTLPLATPSVASTSFVGRIEEVAELARLACDPACRLITVHGLGGVGKTRLAHAVASQIAGRFADGATWISLEGVERPDAVADVIARALGLEIGPRARARDVVVERMRAQERLLVVDNFEQLVAVKPDDPANDPVDLLLALLREAPRVRVLVTSRETLGVQEEWVYSIDGLAHTPADAGTAESASGLPAVELFAQRARQAYLGFSPRSEMPHVLRICASVGGLPLGIELAAAWVRTIPCAEIAQELDRGLDVAPSPQRNRPERHHSLRAVIDFSWRLLTPEQQDVLAALSVFRGGFTRDAADHIARASLRVLSTLVDKALVRRSPDSRFSLHPLVRRFAFEKLSASRSRRTTVRARHRRHFVALLCASREALYGAQHADARALLEDDLDNIRAAWESALDGADAKALRDAARPLCVILDRLDLYDEWTRTFDHALDAFVQEDTPEARAAQCRLLIAAANGHWRRGDAAKAESYRARLAEAIEQSSQAAERAELHRLSGFIEREAGRFDAALRHFVEGGEAARQAGDVIAATQIDNEIGIVHFRRGRLNAARDAFARTLAMNESIGDVFDAPTSRHNVGYCDMELGRFDDAATSFEVALRAFRERADTRGEAMVLSSLGILARRRGDLLRALEHARASLTLAEGTGNRGAIADATDDLAQVVEKLGELTEAKDLYRRALTMARELGQVHLQCFVMLHLARAEAASGERAAAAHSLRSALRLAADHDFESGRLMGLLGTAGLRWTNGDPEAGLVAGAWCRAVLAIAGSSVDVRAAIPEVPQGLLDMRAHAVPEHALELALADAMAFLDALAAQAAPQAREQHSQSP
ncbi:MAG TPA: tetratricopeptide repeat protein [Casimicrobiaceae bacterium]|nr:tetratricopeptide repeat protein [Casimicrobiaceae bacterium]